MNRIGKVLRAAAACVALAAAEGCGPFWVNPYITVEESPLNWMEIHYYNTLDSSRKSTRRVSLMLNGMGHVEVKKGTSKLVSDDFAKGYKDDGRFVQFAMRIAHNLVIDHFRKENRLPTVESSSEDYNYIDNVPITDHSVEQGMVVDQIYSDLHRMITFLPDEQREVLRMRIFDDMSFKDIADITNVSINTALGRMRYALINLRKMMVANNMTLTY